MANFKTDIEDRVDDILSRINQTYTTRLMPDWNVPA